MKTWKAQNVDNASYVGFVELTNSDNYFEIVVTETHLIFGNSTNTGLLQSGNYEMDLDFPLDSNLEELILDLETYYTDGADYCSEPFTTNDRM